MKIQFKNYTLEPDGRNFNLYKTVSATATKETKERSIGETYNRDVEMGYGMRFETCVQSIITDMMADRNEVVTLRQYIDEYKALKNEILLETSNR